MSYVRQQRMNIVQIMVISESIFYPPTMNFAFRTFLCNLMDFRQFTADLSKNKARFKRHGAAVPNSIDRIKFDFSTAVAWRLKPSCATAV